MRLRLRRAAETQVRAGHPWIYAESVVEQNRAGEPGELAVIYSRNDKFLAVGLFDPDSPIRVRVLHAGEPLNIDFEWFQQRLLAALERRHSILDVNTTGARLVHGENDGFPALVLDRYGGTLVLKLYSSLWFPRLPDLIRLIESQGRGECLVLRLSRNVLESAARANLTDGQVLVGPPLDGPVLFLESGLQFEADVLRGQKTGFFLDQRENRRVIEDLSAGRDVLNAFSFSGGFSLYAARGGARSVTDVDISAHALESSRRNFALNDDAAIRNCPHESIQADVFEWLREPSTRRYGLIVLDPPSLARREVERPAAIKSYANLACSGARLARKQAILLCCSCSAHVSAEEFFGAVETGIRRSGRAFTLLRQSREPEDHPVTFPQAAYLKAVYLRLS